MLLDSVPPFFLSLLSSWGRGEKEKALCRKRSLEEVREEQAENRDVLGGRWWLRYFFFFCDRPWNKRSEVRFTWATLKFVQIKYAQIFTMIRRFWLKTESKLIRHWSYCSHFYYCFARFSFRPVTSETCWNAKKKIIIIILH